jgi:hypothetical protein
MGLYRWIFDFDYEKTFFFCIIDDKRLGKKGSVPKTTSPNAVFRTTKFFKPSNEVDKGEIAQNMMKIGLKGP